MPHWSHYLRCANPMDTGAEARGSRSSRRGLRSSTWRLMNYRHMAFKEWKRHCLLSATPFDKPNVTGSSVGRHGLDLHNKDRHAGSPVLSKALCCTQGSISSQWRSKRSHLCRRDRASAFVRSLVRIERQISRYSCGHGRGADPEQEGAGQGSLAACSLLARAHKAHRIANGTQVGPINIKLQACEDAGPSAPLSPLPSPL